MSSVQSQAFVRIFGRHRVSADGRTATLAGLSYYTLPSDQSITDERIGQLVTPTLLNTVPYVVLQPSN